LFCAQESQDGLHHYVVPLEGCGPISVFVQVRKKIVMIGTWQRYIFPTLFGFSGDILISNSKYIPKTIWRVIIHCKKSYSFFVPSRDVTIPKLSLAGNNLIIPDQGEFG
jgi:hypothetical protein